MARGSCGLKYCLCLWISSHCCVCFCVHMPIAIRSYTQLPARLSKGAFTGWLKKRGVQLIHLVRDNLIRHEISYAFWMEDSIFHKKLPHVTNATDLATQKGRRVALPRRSRTHGRRNQTVEMHQLVTTLRSTAFKQDHWRTILKQFVCLGISQKRSWLLVLLLSSSSSLVVVAVVAVVSSLCVVIPCY